MKNTLFLLALAGASAWSAAPVANQDTAKHLPTVTVTDAANREGLLNEERPIGETGRPEWTSARRFSTTRVYIQREPWEVGVGQWWRYRYKRDNSSISRLTSEIE